MYYTADVVLVDVHRLRFIGGLPKLKFPHQKWAFFMIESSMRMFSAIEKEDNLIYNFTVSYKSSSNLQYPYGWYLNV